jgi:hypothetical protein
MLARRLSTRFGAEEDGKMFQFDRFDETSLRDRCRAIRCESRPPRARWENYYGEPVRLPWTIRFGLFLDRHRPALEVVGYFAAGLLAAVLVFSALFAVMP